MYLSHLDEVNFSVQHIETFKCVYTKGGRRTLEKNKNKEINVFQKYLTLWVLFCMIVGVLIGKYIPIIPSALGRMQIAGISVPIAILIWIMIYPMMMKVDFQSIKRVRENPKGLFVTWAVNWLIKPFTMFGIAYLFFFIIFKNIIPNDLANDYLAGLFCLELRHVLRWFLCGRLLQRVTLLTLWFK